LDDFMTIVALTGLTGFVGRNVARALSEEGTPWRGLVRNERKLAALELPAGEIIAGSLDEEAPLERLCAGASAIIHCGGNIAALSRNDFFRANVMGTSRLLAACRKAGVQRFVQVSSLAAREPQLSDYAASKRAGEELVKQEAGDMSWVILRPPAVYGPGDGATIPLIKSLARRVALLPGGLSARLSLIYIADLARALVKLAVTRDIESTIVEIDDGKAGGYNFKEIAAAASQATGVRTRVVLIPRYMLVGPAWFSLLLARATRIPAVFCPGKLAELYHGDWVIDPQRQKLAGWQPQIDFSTGFADTLKWYQQHGWLPEGVGGPGRATRRGAISP
jgi:nucleoside-diphosphate-sugar epimerase